MLIMLFYVGFLSRTFTNHRTAGKGGGHFINSSLPLPPLHKHLDISRAITAESSPLHKACQPDSNKGTFGFRAQVANRCFLTKETKKQL